MRGGGSGRNNRKPCKRGPGKGEGEGETIHSETLLTRGTCVTCVAFASTISIFRVTSCRCFEREIMHPRFEPLYPFSPYFRFTTE
jgi:hypothetical protein